MKVDTMVRDLSTTAVVPALEANMLAFWATYGRAPGAELYEGEDLLRVVTGVSEPLFNGVFRTRLMRGMMPPAARRWTPAAPALTDPGHSPGIATSPGPPRAMSRCRTCSTGRGNLQFPS